jgi:hypothetical protein
LTWPFQLYAGDNLLLTFPLVTLGMGGAAAYLSGRAIAQTWRPFWHVPLYMLALGLGRALLPLRPVRGAIPLAA